jgi:hypothetical protein
MKHLLVKKTKLPYSCPQCKNHGYCENNVDEGVFAMGMMNFAYFCEKCELKWTAYFTYTKDVIEPLYDKQILTT